VRIAALPYLNNQMPEAAFPEMPFAEPERPLGATIGLANEESIVRA
jgi:hypothetical protein